MTACTVHAKSDLERFIIGMTDTAVLVEPSLNLNNGICLCQNP